MKVLSVNCGSSSLKFQMYEMPEEKVLISGVFERIGGEGSFYTIKFNGEKTKKELAMPTHSTAVNALIEELFNYKVIENLDEVKGVGHRIVAGGDKFDKTVVIDDKVVQEIADLSVLAPLHNPAAVIGIKAFREAIPNALMTAVFDTAFHQTMPKENFIYPVPYEWYENYSVRRYGAHGTSHKYVTLRMNEILGRTDTKLITCHIGNGASISAVKDGKCIDTSMGFTPNAGVIMGSRCGDIDATIVTYVMKQANMSIDDMDTALNKKSGLLGISGVSNDSRDIEDGVANNNERCILAQTMFVNRVVDFIAKYYVELNGADAIVFTAGIGENSISVRKQVIEKLAILGIKLDEEANNVRGEERCITTKDSKVACYIIPTDEEVMIARDTYAFIK